MVCACSALNVSRRASLRNNGLLSFHKNELFMIKPSATLPRELSTMSSTGVNSVDDFTKKIKNFLAKAQEIKPNGGVEPALTTQDLEGGIEEFSKQDTASNKDYAAIETACRNIFYALLVSLSRSCTIIIAKIPRRQHQSQILPLVKFGTF